jgi:hypothetical protein
MNIIQEAAQALMKKAVELAPESSSLSNTA